MVREVIEIVTIMRDELGKPAQRVTERIEQLNRATQRSTKQVEEWTGKQYESQRSIVKTTRGMKHFEFEWLSIMFLGMAINKVFGEYVKGALDMTGATELLTETLKLSVFFALEPLLDTIYGIILAFYDLPDWVQKAIGWFLILATVTSGLVMYFAMLKLGLGGVAGVGGVAGLTATLGGFLLMLLKVAVAAFLLYLAIKSINDIVKMSNTKNFPDMVSALFKVGFAVVGLLALFAIIPLAVAGPALIIIWTISFIAANWQKYTLAMTGYWNIFGTMVMRVTVWILKAIDTITFGIFGMGGVIKNAEARLYDWESAWASTREEYDRVPTKFPVFDELIGLFKTTQSTSDITKDMFSSNIQGMTTSAGEDIKSMADAAKIDIVSMSREAKMEMDSMAKEFGLDTGEMDLNFNTFTTNVSTDINTATANVKDQWKIMSAENITKTKGMVTEINDELDKIKKDIKTTVTTTHQVKVKYDFPTFGFFQEGGIVPGRLGQAVPIIAHAGERVIPVGGGGEKGAVGDIFITYNVNVSDKREFENLIKTNNVKLVDDLRRIIEV